MIYAIWLHHSSADAIMIRPFLPLFLSKGIIWRLARVKQSLQYYCSRSTSPRSVSSIWKPFVIVVSPLANLHPYEARSSAPVHRNVVSQITKRSQSGISLHHGARVWMKGKWLDLCVTIRKLDRFTWKQDRLHSKTCDGFILLHFKWESSFLYILVSLFVFI